MAQGNLLDSITEVSTSVMGKQQNEPTGFLQAAARNVSDVTNVSFGTEIESRVIGDVTTYESGTYTPTMTLPEGDGITDTTDKFKLNKWRYFKIPLNGEEMFHISNTDQPADSVLGKYLAKGFREQRNDIELEIGQTALLAASRAYGEAGVTPFSVNYNVVNGCRKILVDNGAAIDNRWNVVMDTSSGMNVRNLSQFQKVNEAGTEELARRGVLVDISGFQLRESAGVASHTAGDGDGYLVDLTAGYSVGDTTIHVDTGTGAILAGDVITFAGDTNQYVVKTGFASDGDGDIVIQNPGLRKTLADGVAITIQSTYTGNIAMTGDAIEFASRAPKQPSGGDAAGEHRQIIDPLSGLTWDYAIYRGMGTATLVVQTFTGVKVWNPFEVATLLG